MNENAKLCVTIGVISAVAVGGALLDTRPLRPEDRHQRLVTIKHEIIGQPREEDGAHSDKKPATPSPVISEQISAKNAKAETACLADEKPSECEIRKIQDRSARFNGYLVFVGFLQFLGLVGGFVVYLRQASIMRQTFLSTHRPMIRVKHVWITNDVWKSAPIVATLVMGNVGSTTAVIRVFFIGAMIVAKNKALPPRITKPPVWPLGRLEIANGFSIEVGGITLLPPLAENDYLAIRSGTHTLYCYGHIEYMDTDERVRTTAFCRRLIFPPDSYPNETGRFRVHHDPDYEYQD